MARFGINPKNTLGISVTTLRKIARDIKKEAKDGRQRHDLALKLWDSKIHEARILASLIDESTLVTEKQMESWVKGLDSWDVCDGVCANLFDKTQFAYEKAIEWTKRDKEFEKRAGFALMAALAWHDKQAKDEAFIKFFPAIKLGATDEHNFVKKTVNWALRQIGKRNLNLNKAAINTARDINRIDSKSARWIASDTLRELESPIVKNRLKQI